MVRILRTGETNVTYTYITDYAGRVRKINKEARAQWQVWKDIQERIVNRRDYKYGSHNSHILLNLARFAHNEMAHYNYLAWKDTNR